MLEIIPKKSRAKNNIDEKKFSNNPPQKDNSNIIVMKDEEAPHDKTYNKNIILGNLMKYIRQTKDSLLFAIFTNIKDYYIKDNTFVIECDNAINYEDIKSSKNIETINNLLQKIDSRLTFRVKLNEDKSSETLANNIKLLRETFGEYIKFIE